VHDALELTAWSIRGRPRKHVCTYPTRQPAAQLFSLKRQTLLGRAMTSPAAAAVSAVPLVVTAWCPKLRVQTGFYWSNARHAWVPFTELSPEVEVALRKKRCRSSSTSSTSSSSASGRATPKQPQPQSRDRRRRHRRRRHQKTTRSRSRSRSRSGSRSRGEFRTRGKAAAEPRKRLAVRQEPCANARRHRRAGRRVRQRKREQRSEAPQQVRSCSPPRQPAESASASPVSSHA